MDAYHIWQEGALCNVCSKHVIILNEKQNSFKLFKERKTQFHL